MSFLFRVVCPAAPINLPTAGAFYSKCACSLESLGDITKTDLRSVFNPKEYNKITYFYSGKYHWKAVLLLYRTLSL